MDDTDKVSSDRFNDLKETLNTRFDGVNHQLDTIQQTLDSFESKDHAAAEFSHLNYRVDAVENQVDDLREEQESAKTSIYRTVCIITSILSLTVAIVSQLLQFIH